MQALLSAPIFASASCLRRALWPCLLLLTLCLVGEAVVRADDALPQAPSSATLPSRAAAASTAQDDPPTDAVPGDASQESDPSSEGEGEEPADWTEQDAQRLDAIREDLRSLLTVQRVLDWYRLTQDEPSMRSEAYRGREDLLSQESLLFLARALDVQSLTDEERRALVLLRREVARHCLFARVSPFDDRLRRAERDPKARLSWLKEPVSYLELLAMLEHAPAERADEIRGELTRIQTGTLGALRSERESMLRALAVELGFPSYLALAEELREASLAISLADAERFLARSEPLHAQLSKLVHLEVGRGAWSSGELFHAPPPDLERYFPSRMALDSVTLLLDGLGLSLRTSVGTPILFKPLAASVQDQPGLTLPVRVPRDIRVAMSNRSGFRSRSELFASVGQALYYANLRASGFEMQSTGPSWRTLGYGELARLVWLEPGFLSRYRQAGIQARLRTPWHWTPVMSEVEIRRFVIWGVWQELTRLRRIAWAQLGLEAILHGADAAVSLELSSSDPQVAALELFSRAQGWALSEGEARTLVLDTTDLLETVDLLKGSILAHATLQSLRTTFGSSWFVSADAGAWLLQQVAPGASTDEAAVAQSLGVEKLELSLVLPRLEALLKEVQVSVSVTP